VHDSLLVCGRVLEPALQKVRGVVGRHATFDVFHHQERRAEERCIIDARSHARNRDDAVEQAHDPRLLPEVVGGKQRVARWRQPQHEPLVGGPKEIRLTREPATAGLGQLDDGRAEPCFETCPHRGEVTRTSEHHAATHPRSRTARLQT
jgi:hypothetical protein